MPVLQLPLLSLFDKKSLLFWQCMHPDWFFSVITVTLGIFLPFFQGLAIKLPIKQPDFIVKMVFTMS